MKLLKTLAVFSLASLVAMNVQAAEKKTQEKPAATQKEKTDPNLAKFNKQVGIKFTQRGLADQSTVVLKYTIENRGKTAINSVNWIGVFAVNNQVFYMQDIPVKFDKPLAAKASTDINLTIPLSAMPQQAQQVFANLQAPVSTLTVAKEVVLSNGSKITVK